MLTLRKDGITLHLFLSVLTTLFIVMLTGLFVKESISQSQQKEQFITAKNSVSKMGDDFKNQTSPDKTKLNNYCYYTSAKYERGDRICEIKYQALFLDTDEAKGKELFNKLILIAKKVIQ